MVSLTLRRLLEGLSKLLRVFYKIRMCKFLEIAFTFFYARPRAFSAVTLKYVVHRITLFETFTR